MVMYQVLTSPKPDFEFDLVLGNHAELALYLEVDPGTCTVDFGKASIDLGIVIHLAELHTVQSTFDIVEFVCIVD